MMTPHAELLRLIGEVAPERVPKWHGRTPMESFVPTEWDEQGYNFRFYDDTIYECVTDNNAHAHIELAAWRMVREWCKKRGNLCCIDDMGNGVHISATFPHLLGTGPDDVTALIAAVRYIKENSK